MSPEMRISLNRPSLPLPLKCRTIYRKIFPVIFGTGIVAIHSQLGVRAHWAIGIAFVANESHLWNGKIRWRLARRLLRLSLNHPFFCQSHLLRLC